MFVCLFCVYVGSLGATTLSTLVNSYPRGGATQVSPTTGIGLTFHDPISLRELSTGLVRISGSLRGEYACSMRLSRDRRTLVVTPSVRFAASEVVTVQVGSLVFEAGGSTVPLKFSFEIATTDAHPGPSFHSDDPILEQQLHPVERAVKGLADLPESQPSDFPGIEIKADSEPAVGDMYLANFRFDRSPQIGTFRMVLDRSGNVESAYDGTPHYYNDFKPIGNGRYSFYDAYAQAFYITDSTFNPIDSLRAANGYVTDGHEFRITPDGNYMILAGEYVSKNMSQIAEGGDSNAVIMSPLIEEFDRDKNLIFEWRAYDHFQVTDATHEDLTKPAIDYCHANAIDFDSDSNIILSCRHMDEITKIDRRTGDIIWRWGGKHNQFTFVGDTTPFSHQHAVRVLPNGHFTMFDNGNFRSQQASYSRAAEFAVDEQNKTAQLVWQYRHTPDAYGFAMGYVQRLPNGNSLIGWGSCNTVSVTELDTSGAKRFEMLFDSTNYSYRVYKFDSLYNRVKTDAAPSAPIASVQVSCSPNPVSNAMTIACSLPENAFVEVALYDMLGNRVAEVANGMLAAGDRQWTLETKRIPSGVYHLRGIVGSSVSDVQIAVVH